jgi:bacterioferritin
MAFKGLSELGFTYTGVSQGLVTSLQQLRIHKAMCLHWGYERLSAQWHAWLEHREHMLDQLLGAQLSMESALDLQTLGKLNVGQTVEEIFQSERRMASDLRELAAGTLSDLSLLELHHADTLKQVVASLAKSVQECDRSMELIRQMGIQNFLATRC